MSVAPNRETADTTEVVEVVDVKVRKTQVRGPREKAQRPPSQGLDGKGVQVDEYKDNPANRRPLSDQNREGQQEAGSRTEEAGENSEPTDVDRPGFDLGGSTGKTHAGKGLGLGDDAKKSRKDWGLPR